MPSGRREPTLRVRFLAASLGLTVLLIGGFSLAILQVIEALEQEFIEVQFRADFVRLADAWLAEPARPPTLPAGYEMRHVARRELSSLPGALRELSPGIHEEVTLQGLEYVVGRRDLPDGALYLMLDARFSPVERLETRILDISLAALATAILIATAAALWLARLVLGPVENLAALATRVEPGEPRSAFTSVARAREIVQIATALDRSLNRFDELLARERAFARDASHELRTPLAVILSSLELLEREATDEPRSVARLARLRGAAEQMQALIEGLLFLARPERRTDPVPGYPASEALQDAIRVQRLSLLPRPPDIAFEVRQDRILQVPRGLLLCVAGNLLRNAVEHGGDSRIELTLDEGGLSVVDHGRGIDETHLATMFEPHHRGPESTGEGLGLSIVKRICDSLGWGLEVTSTPGAGTRFRLHFVRGS